jgi:hypothetical protein
VDECRRWLRIVGDAAVIAGVGALRRRNDKRGTSAALVGCYVDAAIGVVVDHSIVVVPEHKQRRLRALLQHARQLQGASHLQILLRGAHDFRFCFCKYRGCS